MTIPGSAGFSIQVKGQDIEGFVVQTQEGLFAYRNRCPHTGATLNWVPDQFLTADAEFIQCSIHGALFRLNDGFCVYGPCIGQALDPLKSVIVIGDEIFVDPDE